jgi:hypothetical protein
MMNLLVRRRNDMTTNAIEVQATLREDGTLLPDEKLNLPPGRVRLTVRPAAEAAVAQFQQLLHSIRAAQQARGHVPRSAAEIEQDRRTLQAEMDKEIEEAGRLQEESRRLRQQALEEGGQQN